MDRLFLSDNEVKKTEILYHLISARCEMSIHSLKEQTGYSYTKVHNLATEIDAD